MRHLNDAELADIALHGLTGMEISLRQHLETCSDCSFEAATFSSIGSVARSDESLVRPPVGLWDRIAAELGNELSPTMQIPEAATDASHPTVDWADENAMEPGPYEKTGTDHTGHRTRSHSGHPFRSDQSAKRRSRRMSNGQARKLSKAWLVATVVASFVLGGIGAVGIVSLNARDRIDVLEQTTLKPLPGWDALGKARVQESAGRLELVVDLPDNPVTGFREVWLLDVAGASPRLLSVGTLSGDQGTFILPPGLDLEKFNVVDVSHELFDGDPSHSSDSIVRGKLGEVG